MTHKLTNYSARINGPISAHGNGNNIASKCIECGHPLLIVADLNFGGKASGYTQEKPVICKGCNKKYYTNEDMIDADNKVVTIQIIE